MERWRDGVIEGRRDGEMKRKREEGWRDKEERDGEI